MHLREWYRTSQARESPPHFTERGDSPPRAARNRSPYENLESGHFLTRDAERNDSQSYLYENENSRSQYFERNRSSHYSERSYSPNYDFERNPSPPNYHLERRNSPFYNSERCESPVHDSARNTSPSDYMERDNQYSTEPHSHYHRKSRSPLDYAERANSPSYFFENRERFDSRASHSQSPTPELQFEPPYYPDGNKFSPSYSKPYEPEHHHSEVEHHDEHHYTLSWSTSRDVICSTNFPDHTSDSDIRDVPPTAESTPHSATTNIQKKKLKPIGKRSNNATDICSGRIQSLEEIETMSQEKLHTLYISRVAERRVIRLVNEGFSYIEAKRNIIRENFIKHRNQIKLRTDKKKFKALNKFLKRKIETETFSKTDQPPGNSGDIIDMQGCWETPPEPQNPDNEKPVLEENSENVSVVHAGYPRFSVGFEKLKLIQNAIMSAYDRLEQNGPQVRFKRCEHKTGLLWVACADKRSADWLRQIVPQLKPWKGADLTTLADEERIPKSVRCFVYVPDENGERLSADRIVNRLRVSNRGLNTHLWTAVDRSPEEKGQVWTFVIDVPSLNLLQKLNMKPYFGFHLLNFKVQGCR